MDLTTIGIDIVEVKRLRTALRRKKERFFLTTFSAKERAYCLSFQDPAPHFAGTFAAKEAVQKALGTNSPAEIEIRHDKSGRPIVWTNGKRSTIRISITHERSVACAVALRLA